MVIRGAETNRLHVLILVASYFYLVVIFVKNDLFMTANGELPSLCTYLVVTEALSQFDHSMY